MRHIDVLGGFPGIKQIILISFYKNNFIRTSTLKFGLNFIPKTMKNLKFDYENFPNESLVQVRHFKQVFGGRGRVRN